MANAIYPIYKQALLDALSDVDLAAGTVKVTLIDTAAYTYSATHDFFNDVAAGSRIATSAALTTKTVTNGTFDADNVTFTAVSGASVEAFIIWIDTTVETTSRLVAYIDTGQTGLPVTPNGGDITITWDAAGIFTL